MFPTHQRTEPRRFKKSMCEKHPEQNAEEIFCWETKTFHCPLCAQENKINGENVPDAIAKIIQGSEKNCQVIRDSIKKLSERKDRISFVLNDEANPNNLELQKQEVVSSVESAFNKLGKLLDQRKADILKEVEEHFDARTEKLVNEAEEITEMIECGENICQEYSTAPSAKKDANLLKRLLEMEGETEKTASVAEKCKDDPIVQTTIKAIFEKSDAVAESFKGLGRVEETAGIPAPANFRVTGIGWNHADLT